MNPKISIHKFNTIEWNIEYYQKAKIALETVYEEYKNRLGNKLGNTSLETKYKAGITAKSEIDRYFLATEVDFDVDCLEWWKVTTVF